MDSTFSPGPVALVVDDQEACRNLLKAYLAGNGYQVFVAASAHDALEICARPSPPVDIVITDVEMPEMSGVRLAHLLSVLRPDLPVLLISGDSSYGNVSASDALRGFLAKPFPMPHLISKVGELRSAHRCLLRKAG
jgi:CheY-like chemotaxis protein